MSGPSNHPDSAGHQCRAPQPAQPGQNQPRRADPAVDAEPGAAPSRTPTAPARIGAWLGRLGLVLALVALGAVLAALRPQFLTWANLVTVARQISINGILAVGVTYVLLIGGVDLSLGSVVALSGVVAASFAHPGDYPLVVPVAAGVAVGLGCGLINGVVVTLGRVAPFIVTLGMMTAARGLALVLSAGRPVSNLSPEFARLAGGDLLGVPYPMLILGGVALLSGLFLHNIRLGRYLYAVGGNETAARACGLRVGAIKTFAYAVCGALAGLAGVVLASRITAGQPNAGVGYELDAIAAVVIGGTSLSGGVGGVGGTVLGTLLMGVINNGLDLLNVSSYYQQIVKGLIIVSAVWLDQRTKR
jgi:ribose/xylose/arabinose/galactoside ABC-type transport system permease subunit